MKKQTCKLAIIVLFTLFLLLLVGCTEKTDTKTPDENIKTIEFVLQNAFTGPSDELKQILDSEGLADLVQYEEDLYKDYFADESSYLEFVNSYGSRLLIEATKSDYKLKIVNIEYEKTKSKETIYDFTVELQYQKEGSESSEVEMVDGQANLNEEHKIEDMLIQDKDVYKLFNN